MTHGDPKNPNKNPHPVKRYEVIVTADAPGPWDSATGRVAFEVINKDCVPRDSFTGGQNVPNTTYDFELVRVDDKTWKGYFYRDQLQDEDYFGLGICHWDANTVGPIFSVRDEKFNAGAWLDDALRKGPQTTYFKKSAYGNQTLVKYGVQDYSSKDADVIQHPDNYFQITVAIKEATP